MILIIVSALFFISTAFGGSVCPPRSEIYPCTCANVPQSKGKYATIVTCRLLKDSDELEDIFPSLRSMRIDYFYLYDSFWQAHLLGVAGEMKKALPSDWLTLLKIKEIDIVDTTLSSCFACQWKLNCKNSVTTRFKVFNSSSAEKMCVLCDVVGRGSKFPWTGCMSKLKEFIFNYGKLTTLDASFFPIPMEDMTSLNLSYNQIVKIDPNALKNLPGLVKLDLSHNAIEYIDHIFGGLKVKLEFLDVSWNFIKEIGDTLIPSFPVLKVLKADNNVIENLVEGDWTAVPTSLRSVDIRNNPLHCDCNIRWINGTLHRNMIFEGTCSTPEEYDATPIRRASRFMIQRCDPKGVLGTRKPKLKTRSTESTTPAPWRSASTRTRS